MPDKDIVQRLRQTGQLFPSAATAAIMEEAASEIEALRAALLNFTFPAASPGAFLETDGGMTQVLINNEYVRLARELSRWKAG